jgi:hypothetical protein
VLGAKKKDPMNGCLAIANKATTKICLSYQFGASALPTLARTYLPLRKDGRDLTVRFHFYKSLRRK